MRPTDHTYWETVHNSHLNERAFIISTGPSLQYMDISALSNEFTVGINHLLRWDGLTFIPNAWAACEYDDLYKVEADIKHLPIPKWFAHPVWHTYNSIKPDFKPDDTWRWVHTDSHANFAGGEEKWKGQTDLLGLGDTFWRVAVGRTPVMEPALPALVWMGFRQIYLLGVDHTVDDHVYASDGSRNQRIESANKSFARMIPAYAEHGVTVKNCSPNSKAPIPYIALEDVIAPSPVSQKVALV